MSIQGAQGVHTARGSQGPGASHLWSAVAHAKTVVVQRPKFSSS